MGLIDDLKLVTNTKGPQCTVGQLLESLKPDESKAVLEIIDNPDGSLVGLSKVLQSYGKSISPRTLRRHRHRGDTSKDGCACQ